MNFERLKKLYAKKQYPILSVKVGQQLEIHEKVWDGDNTRIWKFKGLVIKVKKPQHPDGTFTIRWTVARAVVEKIYPLSFDKFDKVLLLDAYKVRRAKLYYIRDKVGKDAKMKSLLWKNKETIDLFALAVAEAEKKAWIEAPKEEVKKEDKIEETKADEIKTDEVQENKVETKLEEKKEEVKTENKTEEKA